MPTQQPDSGDEKFPHSAKKLGLFHTIASALVILGAYIGISELLRPSAGEFVYSFWAYWSLLLSSLCFATAILFACMSFSPNTVAAAAEFHPDPDNQSNWHARWGCRLAAISQIGHALVFLACGWMFQSANCILWRYFYLTFGAGVSLVLLSNFVVWLRHKPLRLLMTNTFALTNIICFTLTCVATVISARTLMIFDTVALLMIIAVSSVLANIVAQVQYVSKIKKETLSVEEHLDQTPDI
jgi:hypothetical protein